MRKNAADTRIHSEQDAAQAGPMNDPGQHRTRREICPGIFGNMSGRARMNLVASLVTLFLMGGFLATSYFMPQYANAWPTKYASCMGSGCHVLVDTSATIVTAINGTVGTSVSVAAGGSFEVDWKVTNATGAGQAGIGMEIALPTGWTVNKGTANAPAISGWNSVWDAADGATGTGWATANMFTVATEFAASPDGYTINYNATPWDTGTRNAAYDNATAGDLDGIADNMGTDAIVTVPAGAAPGTYSVVVLGVGHDPSTKSHVKQTLTVTVTGGADATKPVVTAGFAATTPSLSRTIAVTSFAATDDTAVTGYLITTSATAPLSGDAGWLGSAPASFTVGADGSFTLYPWAKDAAGNVSLVYGAPVAVTVDTVLPSVSSTVPANGATATTLNGTVTLNFSENVNCATVTTSSVTISPAVTWNKTSCVAAQAVFTPAGQANSTSYTVTVGTGVQDAAGNAMLSSYPFSYTTSAPAPNNPPGAPSALAQYKSDATTPVSKGRYTNQTTVVFKGTVTDPDSDTVQLDIEIADVAAGFTGTPTCSSTLVASGATAQATCNSLVNGRFKWQARSTDSNSSTGSWTQY